MSTGVASHRLNVAMNQENSDEKMEMALRASVGKRAAAPFLRDRVGARSQRGINGWAGRPTLGGHLIAGRRGIDPSTLGSIRRGRAAWPMHGFFRWPESSPVDARFNRAPPYSYARGAYGVNHAIASREGAETTSNDIGTPFDIGRQFSAKAAAGRSLREAANAYRTLSYAAKAGCDRASGKNSLASSDTPWQTIGRSHGCTIQGRGQKLTIE